MQREEVEYQARMEKLGEFTSKEEEKDGENRDSKATGDGSKQEGGGKDKEVEDKLSEHDEQDVLKGQAGARWKNRNGSSKERSRMRKATALAELHGQDAEVARLGSLGQSRVRRLLSRQADRQTCKSRRCRKSC